MFQSHLWGPRGKGDLSLSLFFVQAMPDPNCCSNTDSSNCAAEIAGDRNQSVNVFCPMLV